MFFRAILIAIGAGFASALLFGLSARGSMMAAILAMLAPLPIMTAALIATHWAGLLAALLAALSISLVFPDMLAFAYFIAIAGPAWLLARLADTPRMEGDGHPLWISLPTLGMTTVLIASSIAIALALAIAWTAGGDYDAAMEPLARRLAPRIEAVIGAGALPAGTTAFDVAAALLRHMPLAAASSTVLTLLGNLWLAGRAAAISGELARPRPYVAAEFGLPGVCLALLAGGLLFGFLDGLPGVAGLILASAVFTGYVLQGLATVHFLTRNWPQRRTALVALYVVLFVIQSAGALVGLLGLVDALFGLRRRSASTPTH